MAKIERTMQQMYPFGSGGMWDVAIFLSLSVGIFTVAMCLMQYSMATYPLILIATIFFMVLAIVAHLWAAYPRHAPYRSSSFYLTAALSTIAAICQIVAMHTDDVRMAVVWGPMAVAMLMASASVFRTARDLYITGISVVLVIVLVIILDNQAALHPFGIMYVALAVVSPVVVIILGQASYSGVAMRTVDAWNQSTRGHRRQQDRAVREEVSQDVARRLSLEFAAESEPVLVSIVHSGQISPEDVEVARNLATRIRSRLLELNRQNWLHAAGADVVDPQDVINDIDDGARSVLVALCVGLATSGVGTPQFVLEPKGTHNQVAFSMTAQTSDRSNHARSELAPFFRVLYVVFEDVRVSFSRGEVSLKFNYGER